jgi:hypothetical protein
MLRRTLALALWACSFAFFGLVDATPAEAGVHSCVVREVAFVGSNRVHIQCSNPAFDAVTGDSIVFFALPTTDVAGSGRVVALGSTAFTVNRPIVIVFRDGDLSGSVFGCVSSNCRRPTELLLR